MLTVMHGVGVYISELRERQIERAITEMYEAHSSGLQPSGFINFVPLLMAVLASSSFRRS